MRRNTATLLKYMAVAACVLFIGPHLLKSLAGEFFKFLLFVESLT